MEKVAELLEDSNNRKRNMVCFCKFSLSILLKMDSVEVLLFDGLGL